MPKIKLNEDEFYYEIYGKGEPLVLVAGFSADHFIWTPIVKSLAEDYQIIFLDNRGVGQSDAPNYPYTVDMMTEDTINLCTNLGLKSAHFLGNSMGGAIVQTIGYKYPQMVKSLLLSNTFIKSNKRLNLQFESYLELRKAKAPISSILKSVIAGVYSLDFLNRDGIAEQLITMMLNNPHPISDEVYANQMHAVITFDSSKWLHKVSSSVMIIYSNDDPLIDLNSSEAILQTLPSAENYCFDKVGHLPHIEKPDLFVDVVKQFLKNVSKT